MTIRDVVSYLVVHQLAGNAEVIKIAELYYVQGVSPSVIADVLGISRDRVRGYITRINDKTVSPHLLSKIIKRCLPLITQVKPLVNSCRCRCGAEVYSSTARYRHVVNEHREVVEMFVEEVLKSLATAVMKERL
jgi:transposase